MMLQGLIYGCVALYALSGISAEDSVAGLFEEMYRSDSRLREIEDIDDIREGDGEIVFKFLDIMNINSGPGFPKSKELVWETASSNSKLKDVIEQKVLGTPVLVENSGRRIDFFRVLVKIRANWAVELAGKVLEEDKPLSTEIGDMAFAKKVVGGYFKNTPLAAWVIGSAGIDGYPGGKELEEYGDEDLVTRCRLWWSENGKSVITDVLKSKSPESE